ncbi:MAG: 4-alpha-glucanotransferase [Gammaproteobacteria bacterium]|nr:4-alpha-glucanotransferase [Gammaproteobacteria bacterium]
MPTKSQADADFYRQHSPPPIPPLSTRRAGVLLPVASLPGAPASGTLGADARRFVDFLAESGFSVWQMLPIGPGESPYHSRATHAGDPRLLDPGELVGDEETEGYEAFCAARRGWLEDYALFTALSEAQGGSVWCDWPEALRDRERTALRKARRVHADAIEQVRRAQFRFEKQWKALRDYARARAVLLFGDLPVFVSLNSADVWAHREYFRLKPDGRPAVVAGVPPDYFSAEGQRWGNPLYDWERLERDDFAWWVDRVATQLARFDLLRIDHFRGLQACWEIPADSPSARHGRWVEVPGRELFEAVHARCGRGKLVAEDLGSITPEVVALRDSLDMPGMFILQFAFDGGRDNPYLPHNHARNAVVYTGTHDNDTTVGWWNGLDAEARARVCAYFDRDDAPMPVTLIRASYASVAQLSVIPMQDLLRLGSAARLNTPGTADGNWSWRFGWDQLPPELAGSQRRLLSIYERLAV